MRAFNQNDLKNAKNLLISLRKKATFNDLLADEILAFGEMIEWLSKLVEEMERYLIEAERRRKEQAELERQASLDRVQEGPVLGNAGLVEETFEEDEPKRRKKKTRKKKA